MDIKKIIESGLLEYYTLDLLSEEETQKVEEYIAQYPALKKELRSIELALKNLALRHGIEPKRNLKEGISELVNINKEEKMLKFDKVENKRMKVSPWSILSMFLAIAAFGFAYNFFASQNRYTDLKDEFTAYKMECEEKNTANQNKALFFDAFHEEGNQVAQITPTENYADTKLIFFSNENTKKNYIQILNLPDVRSDQAYQLWSLKEDQDPIPLNVFMDDSKFVEVDFEEGTGTYAITIEKKGGVKSPTLSQLIGTVTL